MEGVGWGLVEEGGEGVLPGVGCLGEGDVDCGGDDQVVAAYFADFGVGDVVLVGEGADGGGGLGGDADYGSCAGFAEEGGVQAVAEVGLDLDADVAADGGLGEGDGEAAFAAVVGGLEELGFGGGDQAVDEGALGGEVDVDRASAAVVADGEVFACAER